MKKNYIIPVIYIAFTLSYIAILHRMTPEVNNPASIFDLMGHYWIGYLMLFGIIISTAILGIANIKDEVYQHGFTQVFMASFIIFFVILILFLVSFIS